MANITEIGDDMTGKDSSKAGDPEIVAIARTYEALKDLKQDAQTRVIEYVTRKLGVRHEIPSFNTAKQEGDAPFEEGDRSGSAGATRSSDRVEEAPDGISEIAHKWMRRNELSESQLAGIFSLGGETIDLIAKKIPGKSKRQRVHQVILLEGAASYLGTGAARVSHERLKETCLHYDAYDAANFAAHLKDFSSDYSGTKQAGYTLNQRGLVAAAKLLKELVTD